MTVVPASPFVVAACRPEQAEEYVAVHVGVMCETYAHLPAAAVFTAARRAEVPERVRSVLADMREAGDADAAGRPPHRRHVVGLDAGGRIVGVACGGLGVEAWEASIDPPLPPPPTPWCLSHLYLLPEAHGSGLSVRLMDAALAGAPSSYLWVYPDNPRAVAFYRRHGWVGDGVQFTADPDWGAAEIVRMVRRPPSPAVPSAP